jgi:hypothetical protein
LSYKSKKEDADAPDSGISYIARMRQKARGYLLEAYFHEKFFAFLSFEYSQKGSSTFSFSMLGLQNRQKDFYFKRTDSLVF